MLRTFFFDITAHRNCFSIFFQDKLLLGYKHTTNFSVLIKISQECGNLRIFEQLVDQRVN